MGLTLLVSSEKRENASNYAHQFAIPKFIPCNGKEADEVPGD